MVLRIIPTGNGKTHEVQRDGRVLGHVERRVTLDGIRWGLHGEAGLLSFPDRRSRTAAAVMLADVYDGRST